MRACYSLDWDCITDKPQFRTQYKTMMKLSSVPNANSSLKIYEYHHYCELAWDIGRGRQPMVSAHPSHNMVSIDTSSMSSPLRSCVVRPATPTTQQHLGIKSVSKWEVDH